MLARARRLALGIGPAAALALVCAWEVCTLARAGGDTGEAGDWARAAEAVRERRSPGDLIVFAPDWVDPVGRLHLGDAIPIDMAARMDAARYGTIWELSVRGARADETAGAEAVWREVFGDVTVTRWQKPAAEIVTDFVAAAGSARFEGGRGALSLEEVGFEPHRCMKLVPSPGRSIRVVYPDVALGTELVGYVGLADVFTRRDVREPGTLRVSIDGEVVAETRPGVDDGWVRFAVPTVPRQDAEVVFEASAAARDRQICFAAEARR